MKHTVCSWSPSLVCDSLLLRHSGSVWGGLQHHGGLGHVAWSDHRPEPRQGFSRVAARWRALWGASLWRKAAKCQASHCQDGLLPASRETVPSPGECRLTVFGLGTLLGQKAEHKLAFLTFWSDVELTLTDFHPSPSPAEMKRSQQNIPTPNVRLY